MNATLRPAQSGDARSIAHVHLESSRAAYRGILPAAHLDLFTLEKREQLWTKMLAEPEPRTVTLVAVDGASTVVGFASGGPERTGQLSCDGELYTIYLLPSVQRQGVGTLLLTRFINELRTLDFTSMAVWVLAASPFRRFYEKHGGQVVAEKTSERAGHLQLEVAYRWTDLSRFHVSSHSFLSRDPIS